MEDDKDNKPNANVSINIQNSTVQVVPNATEANMIFYGDQFAPKDYRQPMISSDAIPDTALPPVPALQPVSLQSSDEKLRAEAISTLQMHITEKARLDNYLQNLALCKDAVQLAQVAVSMRKNEKWPDEVEIKKERFINLLKVLAPGVTKGDTVSNIRARIKAIL